MRKSVRRLIEPLESRLLLSAHVWTGAAGDGDTSNAANWGTGGSPVGDTSAALIFPANIGGTVNFVPATSAPKTVLVQGGYTLAGVAITPQFINIQDDLGTTATVNVALDATTLEKLGNGTVVLDQTLDGTTLKVDAGTLQVNNFASLAGLQATSQSTLVLSPTMPIAVPNASSVISLGGAQLGLSSSVASTLGEAFTVLTTTGNITGTFANIPEGGRITVNGHAYGVSYLNDAITLTDEQHTNASNADYVTALYNSLLNRSPSSSDLSYWTTALDAGQTSFSEVANTFLSSPEYYQNEVQSVYSHLLGRVADTNGLAYWTGVLESGETLQYVQSQIAGSVEFFVDAGNTTNFVNNLFNDFLGRDAGAAELTAYTATLDGTAGTRINAATTVLNSTEGRAYRVNIIYENLLFRPTDPQATSSFVDEPTYLAQDRLIIYTILTSNEYLTDNGATS
jgi:hypothetical protein